MADYYTAVLSRVEGAAFGLAVTAESDDTVTLLGGERHGYRSAHRDYARELGRPHCLARLRWVNTHGVRMVLTRWAVS